MKTFYIVAALGMALGMALAAPIAAFAGQAEHPSSSGHYGWRSVPQFGPRATGPARVRAWVPDSTQQASAADCMKEMHSMASPSSTRPAS